MTTFTNKTITPTGAEIVRSIIAGFDKMTPARWAEIEQKAKDDPEVNAEWWAPEFADARSATEGIEWDFTGWNDACNAIMNGPGMLGGVSLVSE